MVRVLFNSWFKVGDMTDYGAIEAVMSLTEQEAMDYLAYTSDDWRGIAERLILKAYMAGRSEVK